MQNNKPIPDRTSNTHLDTHFQYEAVKIKTPLDNDNSIVGLFAIYYAIGRLFSKK